MTPDSPLFSALDPLTVALEPSDPPARVLTGEPRCAERIIAANPAVEIGVWEVTPGRFLSTKTGVGEVMHFVAGAGTLTHPSGQVTTIAPGVTVSLAPGWSGEWDVTATVRKVYAIYSESPTETAS